MSTVYGNYPMNPTELWVMGFVEETRTYEFLFHAKIGDIKYYEKIAWNPTDFERAVKQKCRAIRKETGIKYSFSFYDHRQMQRAIDSGRYEKMKDFPKAHYESTLTKNGFKRGF